MNLQQVLEGLASGAGMLSATPGPAGVAARIASLAFTAAATISRLGKDPEVEIKRILAADPLLTKVHEEWDRLIAERWPSPTPTPQPPDTLPDADKE
jgi:hypothetical protein